MMLRMVLFMAILSFLVTLLSGPGDRGRGGITQSHMGSRYC